ncbi:hypothetical protein [Herpetosiphon llansteffanensis]|uniref:hypothetical protein n=1 Tax=Herpetosiphon llansteffanensis TaxID=2094568 RepID=UPI000D7BAE0D|nr:hypothetical protein [Herpetosiphon llansteffanensis]
MSLERLAAFERLANNERLTDNLTDTTAKALLRWAEQQIEAGVAEDEVLQAAHHANRDDLVDVTGVLAAANAALNKGHTAVVAHTTPAPDPAAQAGQAAANALNQSAATIASQMGKLGQNVLASAGQAASNQSTITSKLNRIGATLGANARPRSHRIKRRRGWRS